MLKELVSYIREQGFAVDIRRISGIHAVLLRISLSTGAVIFESSWFLHRQDLSSIYQDVLFALADRHIQELRVQLLARMNRNALEGNIYGTL